MRKKETEEKQLGKESCRAKEENKWCIHEQ
jgi:hypothetical protein